MRKNSGDSKHLVCDTCYLVNNPEKILDMPNKHIYIPFQVLEELDRLKTKGDKTGWAARQVNKQLDSLRSDGYLFNGVSLSNGQKIVVLRDIDISILPDGAVDNVDNKVMAAALKLMLDHKKGGVSVLTDDLALRIKCDSVGIDSRGTDHVEDDAIFMGIVTEEISQLDMEIFYSTGELTFDFDKYYPNQGVVLKCERQSALAIAKTKNKVRKLKYAGEKDFTVSKLSPRNKEQIFASELLLDPKISLVTLTGGAGSGKTILAAAAAMELMHATKSPYKKIIMTKPNQSMSKDIGFLPGSKNEKLEPWLAPIFDNLEKIFSEKSKTYIQMMLDKGTLQMEALTYLRGRSFSNTIFLVDEAQNISYNEAKAIITRMGDNSKLILTGDLEQIDSTSINESTSGLRSAIDLFKEFDGSGHIHFTKCERSALADYAIKNMK